MRRGYDMTGQLCIDFTQNAPDAPKTTAERLLDKYLRITQQICDQYYKPMDGDNRRGNQLMTMSEEAYERAIKKLRTCERFLTFDSIEKQYAAERAMANNWEPPSREHRKDEHRQKARELLDILDAFGFIQEEYDKSEEFWDQHTPIGYHYWLFEDPIARVPVPETIITRYIHKYKNEGLR